MLDFKLISVDDHVNEHPAAWERAQREFGDRVPHIIENPPDLGKGLWIIAEGLPPVRSAYFALGHVVEKPEGYLQHDSDGGPGKVSQEDHRVQRKFSLRGLARRVGTIGPP